MTQRTEAEIMASWGDNNDVMLSIHCLTFNHANFIENAINGFLMQETNFRFEVLINDDASNDGNQEIIRRYAAKYPNLILPIYQVNNTYSKGHKTAFFNSMRVKGRYTALCEGDDFWVDKDKLQKQVDYLETHSDVVMCGHDVSEISADGEVIRLRTLNLSKGKRYSQNEIIFGFNLPSKSAVWRSNLPCLGPKMPFGDTFLFSYYGNFGKAYNFKEVMGVYRIHLRGVWSGLSAEEQIDSSKQILKQIPEYILPNYKSIAYCRLLLFLFSSKATLSSSNTSSLTFLLLFFKNLSINSFVYISYKITRLFFYRLMKLSRLIK